MATIRVESNAVGALLRSHARKHPEAMVQGLRMAAQRIAAYLKKVSPVDQGRFKNAWRTGPITNPQQGTLVFNDAPYAGVIEMGARPHPVSREGIEAIARWAEKHGMGGGGPSDVEGASKAAIGVAYAIANKIREKGQKALYLVRNNLEVFLPMLQEEVERALNAAAAEGK